LTHIKLETATYHNEKHLILIIKSSRELEMKKLILILTLTITSTFAKPVLMSEEYAQQLCEAWNQNNTLQTELKDWMGNDLGRGFKIMRMKRLDCKKSDYVQLTIEMVDGKVTCTYGGAQTVEPNNDADYSMKAKTKNWKKMGSGKLGPMGAMSTFRLKFKGPKWEAMKNMGPFSGFLRLIGKVKYSTSSCPQ
jgi:putative sterol carrier protein